MKILELNGHKYSREQFEGYKFRAMFQFEVKGQQHFSNVTVYTTDSDKPNVFKVIEERTTEKVHVIKLVHWASREQDEMTSKFIEETLKDI